MDPKAANLARDLVAALSEAVEQMAPMPTPLTLYSSEETAKRLSIAPETLCRWRLRGEGPAFVRQGRYVRYTAQAVEQWISERTAGNVIPITGKKPETVTK